MRGQGITILVQATDRRGSPVRNVPGLKYNFTLVDVLAVWTRTWESCRSLPYRSYVALAGHPRSQHAGPPSRSPAHYIGGRTLVSPNWSLRKTWARHGLRESANRIWET